MRVISMDWRDVLVASWPVDPDVVAPTLPDGLAVHERGSDAWLSVVPFVMANVRPWVFPRPLGRTFGELNLRTYVHGPEGPGIYFFNLDASDRVGVALARRFFSLPYYRADVDIDREGNRVAFESTRTHPGAADCKFDATYRPVEDPSRPAGGSLDAFLFERYRFYVERDGGLLCGEIHHDPWRVAKAEVEFRENELFAANGFDRPESEPHLSYSPGVAVTARWLKSTDS